ncbi:MAG TPA: glycosyltransferase family 4 protein [Tepidisphaeraceae bacterium]|jgi:glycosyltransferase involved in cell wall biosynthesis|nr:glycosyltransferase family 4 protein [Tepidisphaeraceae bacterium]
MTKVIMTTDAVGGIWTYALDLCRALACQDVEIILATMGPAPTSAQRAEVGAMLNVTLHESSFRLEWMPEPWDDVRRAGQWLLDLERSEAPDIIHLNGYAHGSLPWNAPTLIAAHSCVLSWWQAVKGKPAPSEWAIYRRMVESGLRSADLVIAPSYAMLNALERHYCRLRRTRVIYNGRSASLYRSGAKKPYVLSAGRLWDEAKNIVALDRIARRIAWPVRVAGQTAAPDGVSIVGEHVQLLGKLDTTDLAEEMSHASIYALPARYEPFGLSALEAAHSGCALVLGDIDSLREVWGDAAIFASPDDEGAMIGAINLLISNSDLRREMSLRAAARAQRYSLAQLGQHYRDAYDDIRHSIVEYAATPAGGEKG